MRGANYHTADQLVTVPPIPRYIAAAIGSGTWETYSLLPPHHIVGQPSTPAYHCETVGMTYSRRFAVRSTYVSAGASAEEVEGALEGLEPTGDLTVTRSENDNNGYDWQVRTASYSVHAYFFRRRPHVPFSALTLIPRNASSKGVMLQGGNSGIARIGCVYGVRAGRIGEVGNEACGAETVRGIVCATVVQRVELHGSGSGSSKRRWPIHLRMAETYAVRDRPGLPNSNKV